LVRSGHFYFGWTGVHLSPVTQFKNVTLRGIIEQNKM
jgi:hypothetical protein